LKKSFDKIKSKNLTAADWLILKEITESAVRTLNKDTNHSPI
jgi:hypothetical protein